MIRAHARKERSHTMPDEAAFFHQVRALVHQWRRLTIGRLSFKREAPPDTSPRSDLDVWVSALAPGYAHADENKVRAVVTEALRIAQSEHAGGPVRSSPPL